MMPYVEREEKRVMAQYRYEEERVRRGKMVAMLARMARRPWKKNGKPMDWDKLQNMKTVQTLREMKHEGVKKVVRAMHQSMDQVSRSITQMNLRAALKVRKDIVFQRVQLNSPVFRAQGGVKVLKKCLNSWCCKWESRHGVLVIVEVLLVERSSRSIAKIADNCAKKGRSKIEELE